MTTSNMRVSTVDYHCMPRKYSAKSNVQTSPLDRNPSCGPTSSRDVKHLQTSQPDLKPEFFHSKDASKRKRVNRTAKLKQCKLDARREQWLSQGNQSRGKHEDQDCHDDVGLKSNSGGSPGICSEQGFPLKSSGPFCSKNLDPERNLTGIEENGAESSPLKQVMSLRWKGTGDLEPPELNRMKNQSKDKDVRFRGGSHDEKDTVEVQGKSLMHKCCLTDRKSIPSNVHLSSTLLPDSKSSEMGRKGTVILSDERTGRMHVLTRSEEDMLVPSDSKHDRGAACRGCSEAEYSPAESTSSCASCVYAGTSTGENGNTHSHDAEDDWEAVADAIYMQGTACKPGESHKALYVEKDTSAEKQCLYPGTTDVQKGALKPEYKYKAGMLGGRMRGMGGRAWRPDDASRPPTLPRLSKQHSFPVQSSPSTWNGLHGSNLWGPPPAPLYCPICTEELDVTDSSFVPCSCGFRLCLFCHHRIAAEDGRCPGCRKTYNSDVAVKLSRSSTVWLRV